MPPHPFNASLCHVIEAGLKNIQRLQMAGKHEDVTVEVKHLLLVEAILSSYCLYNGTPRYDKTLFEQYWLVSRRDYMSTIDLESLVDMMIAWEFLAPDRQAFINEEAEPFWVKWRERQSK